jgi:hypothetical protein
MLVKRGYTEAEALAHVTNPANQVPADFGPDWIDSPETIHQHFEEQGMIKKQNYEL